MKKVLLSISLFVGLAASAFGQTALTQTTLSAAVADSATTLVKVTSATGITAGNTILFVAKEAMFVNAVSGTTLGVTRGYFGTRSNPHISLATVLAGPPNAFQDYDPSGACTAANTLYTPWVNVQNGYQWLCSTVVGKWVPGFNNVDFQAEVTAAVASAAGQVTPSGQLFHMTGALAITGFTSAVGMGGTTLNATGAPFCIIPDAAFTTTATNNIALASTAVINRTLCYTFDGTNKKYVPTY